MTTTTLKIKNGTIKLPKDLQKSWKQADVLLFPTKDTLIVKKVQNPIQKLSEIADRITFSPLTQREVAKEVAEYRRKR